MKNKLTILSVVLLLTTVACNEAKKKASSILTGTALDLNDILGKAGSSACYTTNLDKIGTSATTGTHSYKYSVNIQNNGQMQFSTTVYDDASCTLAQAGYSITFIGDLAVTGVSSSVSGGTNITMTQDQIQYTPSNNSWKTIFNSACSISVNVSAVGLLDGIGCLIGGQFLTVSFPATNSVLKNVVKYVDHGGYATLSLNMSFANHLGMYTFGSTSSYPTSANVDFTVY